MSATTVVAAEATITPTIRQAGLKARFWIVFVVVLVVIAIGSLVVTGMVGPGGVPLSSTNPSPVGSKAIAQVLRSQGVTVTASDSMEATKKAIGNNPDATIFLVDDGHYLNDSKLRILESLVQDLVIMTPDFDQLEVLAPQLAQAGDVSEPVHADCDVRAVTQAQNVTGQGSGYRVIGDDSGVTACLGSGDDIFSFIQVTRGDSRITVLGTRDAFSNEFVSSKGNAALALGVLGQHSTLVWMLPAIDEAIVAPGSESPGEGSSGEGSGENGGSGGILSTLGYLTPDWVTPVIVLLVLAVIAAGFWRGRRFGPLAVENLPVFVRASETMEGRARLYSKSRARLHALDALRMGTIERLGRLCGLGNMATVDDVIFAVASITGLPIQNVSAILRDDGPRSERDLVQMSDALLNLESATSTSLRPHTDIEAKIDSSTTIDSTAPTQEPGE